MPMLNETARKIVERSHATVFQSEAPNVKELADQVWAGSIREILTENRRRIGETYRRLTESRQTGSRPPILWGDSASFEATSIPLEGAHGAYMQQVGKIFRQFSLTSEELRD